MKRLVYGAIAIIVCFGMVSCGSENNDGGSTKNDLNNAVTDSEVVLPEYNTFSMSVDDLVNKLNSSGDFTKTWSADCSTQDLGDGKTSFKTNEVIIGAYWNGSYETATNNIIDITISYPSDENDAESGMVACAAAEPIMEYLFNIDQDTAMSEWMKASKDGSSGYNYGDYKITVAYNSLNEAMETIITPKNELK